MVPQSIVEIHKTKKGKVSDKWESYLHYYDRLFGRFSGQGINILEIGIQNGGSLETWAAFFESANLIIGCDIDERCGGLQFNDTRISVVTGDSVRPETVNIILGICENFDIVIDDGSHVSADIVGNFVNYFPLLAPQGLFIVEDTHALYTPGYGDGILNENGAINFFRRLTDVVNLQFWQDILPIDTYLKRFFPHSEVPNFIKEGWIESIEFRNSIITITKSDLANSDRLGQRLISGDVRLG